MKREGKFVRSRRDEALADFFAMSFSDFAQRWSPRMSCDRRSEGPISPDRSCYHYRVPHRGSRSTPPRRNRCCFGGGDEISSGTFSVTLASEFAPLKPQLHRYDATYCDPHTPI